MVWIQDEISGTQVKETICVKINLCCVKLLSAVHILVFFVSFHSSFRFFISKSGRIPLSNFHSFPLPITNSNMADAIFVWNCLLIFEFIYNLLGFKVFIFYLTRYWQISLILNQLLTSPKNKTKLQGRQQLTPNYLTASSYARYKQLRIKHSNICLYDYEVFSVGLSVFM